MPASSSYVDGLSVGPPRQRRGAERVKSSSIPLPATTATTPQAAVGSREPLRPLLDLLEHVGHVEARDGARAGEQLRGALGRVRVDVDLERALVADDEHGVADRLERLDPGRWSSPSPVTAKFVQ